MRDGLLRRRPLGPAALPLTLIDLPESHHAFELVDDLESSRDAMRRTGAFLNEHLGP